MPFLHASVFPQIRTRCVQKNGERRDLMRFLRKRMPAAGMYISAQIIHFTQESEKAHDTALSSPRALENFFVEQKKTIGNVYLYTPAKRLQIVTFSILQICTKQNPFFRRQKKKSGGSVTKKRVFPRGNPKK